MTRGGPRRTWPTELPGGNRSAAAPVAAPAASRLRGGRLPNGWGVPPAAAAIAFAALLFGAEGALGQAQPRVEIEPDTTEIHLGDPLALRLSIEHAAEMSVRWPDSIDLGPFELLAAEVGETVAEPGELARTTALLHVTAFELGELEVPSFELELVGASGEAAVAATDPVVIGVTTVGLEEGGDIRDVKGPRSIARNWLLLWPYALLALALAGGVFWGLRKWRRGGAGAPRYKPMEPPRPAHEIALEALARLEASPLLDRGEIKRYHIEVSEIVRRYVEDRYRIWAREMITPDIVSELERAGVGSRVSAAFDDFLASCDLVKFAKVRPEVAQCRRTLSAARELVERTKFVPTPEPSPAAVSSPAAAQDGGGEPGDGGAESVDSASQPGGSAPQDGEIEPGDSPPEPETAEAPPARTRVEQAILGR